MMTEISRKINELADVSDTDVGDMRKAFEIWASDNNKYLSALTRSGDGYVLMTTNLYWQAWQAATRQAATDASHNAPWLSLAHMVCTYTGIPEGHIGKRIEALHEKLSQKSFAAPVQDTRTRFFF